MKNTDCFELYIIFRDGISSRIEDVEEYGFISADGLFFYIKNDFKAFMPREAVTFIGKYADFTNR